MKRIICICMTIIMILALSCNYAFSTVSADKHTTDNTDEALTAETGGTDEIVSITDTKVRTKISFAKEIPEIAECESISYTRLRIRWADMDVSGYDIYRSTSQKGTYKKIASVKDSLKYTDKDLTCGKTYYYKVRAFRYFDGKKTYSKYSNVIKGIPVPKKIGNFQVCRFKDHFILEWIGDKSYSGYQIQYRYSQEGGNMTKWSILKGCPDLNCGEDILNRDLRSFLKEYRRLIESDPYIVSFKDKEKVPEYQFRIRPFRIVSGKKVYGEWTKVTHKDFMPTEAVIRELVQYAVSVGWESDMRASSAMISGVLAETSTIVYRYEDPESRLVIGYSPDRFGIEIRDYSDTDTVNKMPSHYFCSAEDAKNFIKDTYGK